MLSSDLGNSLPNLNVSSSNYSFGQSESTGNLTTAEQLALSSNLLRTLNMTMNYQTIQTRMTNANFSEIGGVPPAILHSQETLQQDPVAASYANLFLTGTQTQQHLQLDQLFDSMRDNTRRINEASTFPELARFDLSTLEPTPIAENATNQQNLHDNDDDTKPMAKRWHKIYCYTLEMGFKDKDKMDLLMPHYFLCYLFKYTPTKAVIALKVVLGGQYLKNENDKPYIISSNVAEFHSLPN
jgi:hypothetical protein